MDVTQLRKFRDVQPSLPDPPRRVWREGRDVSLPGTNR